MSDVEHEIHDRLVNLQTQIKNMSGDVVLVGDIMLDRYIHGYANNLNSSPCSCSEGNRTLRGRWGCSTRC